MKLIRTEKVIEQCSSEYPQEQIEKMKMEVNEKPIKDLVSQERIDMRENHVMESEGVSIAATERILGINDLVDINYLARGINASRAVCRIILRDANLREIGYATGFKPSPNLLITNYHVLETSDDAKNSIIEFNYELDTNGNPKATTRFRLSPERFFVNNERLDYAVVAINPVPIFGNRQLLDFGFLRLNPGLGKINKGEYATIIQHPGGQTKQIAIRDNKIINDISDDDFTLMYYSDTAQGSSGAPVFNDSWQVVALHYTGVPRKDENGNWLLKNGSIATRFDDDADIDWIANSGIRASRIVKNFMQQADGGDPQLRQEFISACNGDIASSNVSNEIAEPSIVNHSSDPNSQSEPVLQSNEIVGLSNNRMLFQNVINLPLTFSVHLGTPETVLGQRKVTEVPSVSPGTNSLLGLEAKIEPFHDRDYTTRKGYDPDFLEVTVPLPKVLNSVNLSKMSNGEFYLPYHKFTVVNNKKRKLALYTASNVDASRAAKRPEPGKVYNRKALGGLRDNDREKWFVDPRIPQEDQLSDEFYNKDRTAFDKGHLVRRDDVAWGKDYLDVRHSNGDTYHITNCSPQVLGFNRSREGGKWGKLENNILKQAKKEKLSVFSGPLLKDNDPIFHGVNFNQNIQVPIPRAYWKVINAVTENGELQSFAFLLSQDLSRVPFEFDVQEEWKAFMVSIDFLEEITSNIKFPKIVKDADQFNLEAGEYVINEIELGILNT